MPIENIDRVTLYDETAVYSFLHDLFRYPTRDQWNWLNRDEVRTVMETLVQQYMPNDFRLSSIYPQNQAEYEETFIAMFEVGVPHPPCPLIETHWNKTEPVSNILHENILFFKAFGLRLKSMTEETSDHLRYQLEFYRYLSTMLLRALHTGRVGDTAAQLIQARRDYRRRHLANWIPLAADHIDGIAPDCWCSGWVRLLERCVAQQAEYDSPSNRMD